MSKLLVQVERVEDLIGRADSYFSQPKTEPKPQTNADRIRHMSDEELAKLFVSGWFDGPLFTCPVKDDGCESDIPCDVCFLNWLKATVEEVQDG